MVEQITMFGEAGVETVSRREFAELVGKSEPLIRKYIAQGKITALVDTPKGSRLNLAVALEQWRSFHPAEGDGEAAEVQGGSSYTEMQHASLRRLLAQAEREELELSILRGTHIHVEEIRAVFEPMITTAKHKLYQVEDLLVSRLPGNPVENGRTVRQVIDEICQELVYVDPKPRKKRGRKTVAAAE